MKILICNSFNNHIKYCFFYHLLNYRRQPWCFWHCWHCQRILRHPIVQCNMFFPQVFPPYSLEPGQDWILFLEAETKWLSLTLLMPLGKFSRIRLNGTSSTITVNKNLFWNGKVPENLCMKCMKHLGLMSLPAHPQSSPQSMRDFLKLGSGIEDGPRMTSQPLDSKEWIHAQWRRTIIFTFKSHSILFLCCAAVICQCFYFRLNSR